MVTRLENRAFTKVESDIVTVGTTITLGEIDATQTHCFGSVQFFADAEGNTPATPGAGTVALTAKTVNSEQFEAITDSPIDATAPTTLNWAANTKEVRAVPTGVTVATHYKLVVTTNKH